MKFGFLESAFCLFCSNLGVHDCFSREVVLSLLQLLWKILKLFSLVSFKKICNSSDDMDSNGTDGKTPVHFENGGKSCKEEQKDLDPANGVNHFVESKRKSLNNQFCTESSNAMENERKNSLEVADNAASWKSSAGLSNELDRHGTILSSGAENKTSDGQYEACTTPKKTNMVQHSSAIDIPYSTDLSISPLIQAKGGLFFIFLPLFCIAWFLSY